MSQLQTLPQLESIYDYMNVLAGTRGPNDALESVSRPETKTKVKIYIPEQLSKE